MEVDAPRSPASSLIVRVDRRRVNRRFTSLLGLQAALLVVLLGMLVYAAGSLSADYLSAVAVGLSVTIFVQACQMALIAWDWGVQATVEPALVVSASGVALPVPPHGPVFLPWEVIASIRVRRRHLVVRPAPGVSAETPGVEGAGVRRLWRRLRRRGALIPRKLVDADVATISRAVAELSGGRVQVKT